MDFKDGDKILCKKNYYEHEYTNRFMEILDDMTIPLFEEGKYYTVTGIKFKYSWYIEDFENFIIVNNKIVERSYFYTKKEERKLKLEKIDRSENR